MSYFRFKYTLLQYRHSAILNESINIGILIYFNDSNRFEFRYSNRLNRIKNLYDDVPDRVIRHYLKRIDVQLSRFNKYNDNLFRIQLEESFDGFISENLLPKDGSSLQFSNPIKSEVFGKSEKDILKYLTTTYLIQSYETRIDKDKILLNKFSKKIEKNFERINKRYFKKNYTLELNSGVQYSFKYAWKNGSLNLVNPLNFDLSDIRYISDKAHKNFGLVADLENNLNKGKKFHYDFLVGRPENKDFFKEYDRSINLLSSLNSIRIIEEEEIDEYADKALRSLMSND